MHKVVEVRDCSVLCGYRSQEDQDKAFSDGYSRVRFPHSKHNRLPSVAVDVVPYPIAWEDIEGFKSFGFFVLGVAHAMDIPLLWGADWNMNYILTDERFVDMPHYELLGDVSHD